MNGFDGSALIGHSGFVGGNLLRQRPFEALFRSSDIDQIAGHRFDLVVCAGVSAVKWLANREPDNDRAGIARLLGPLGSVEARRFVLISTVDVYSDPAGVDEASPIRRAELYPYGLHRLELEDFVRARFPGATILRLPALFGPGLKKNVLYDLLHANQLERIHPASSFQWYPISRLWRDIECAMVAGAELINLVTEPVTSARLLDFFPDRQVGADPSPVATYDIRTRFGALFGGDGQYLMTAAEVLRHVATFVAEERDGRNTSGGLQSRLGA